MAPAAAAAVVMAGCVALGLRSPGALLAFGLGAFSAASAIAQIASRWPQLGPRALLGGSGGGMVVHIGFAVLAVAVAGSGGFAERADLRLEPGEAGTALGHRFELLGLRTVEFPNRVSQIADVRIDGDRIFRPALSQFPFASQAIGTPSVQTSLTGDIYLTLVATPRPGSEEIVLGVRTVPLAVWLWTGVLIMGLGTALALGSPRRRAGKRGSEESVPRPSDIDDTPQTAAHASEGAAPNAVVGETTVSVTTST
jgi:cytochrome c-type biogenesis protein CcmF